LLRAAIDRGALIVVLRGLKLWALAVQNLHRAEFVEAHNRRTGRVSPGNLGSTNYDRVVATLRE